MYRALFLLLLLFIPFISFSQAAEWSEKELLGEALFTGAVPDGNVSDISSADENYFTEEQQMVLNKEYAHLLSTARSEATGSKVTVIVDKRLEAEAIIFCFIIALQDTSSEDVVTYEVTQIQEKDLKLVAREAFESFKESPERHAIQMSSDYKYVWVEFGEMSSIVNFSRTPSSHAME